MAGFDPKKQLVRWLKGSGRPALNRVLARYSEVGDPIVFDNALFPWTRRLEQEHEAIREEALRLLELREHLPGFHEVSPYQSRISDADMWKTVWLYGFGYRSEIVSRLCPVTARVIDEVPELKSALFSMLGPGKHIPPHRGVYKGLINYHLGLINPDDPAKAHMRVGTEHFFWETGKSVVFDDTNEHEVWNESDQERVVLFLQFHRPMRFPGRQLSELFLRALALTPYLKVPLANAKVWEEQLRVAALERGLLPAS